MDINPISWRDIRTLHQNRHNSVFFDTALLLTRGSLLIQGALLSYLAPSLGISTCIAKNRDGNKKSIIGQVIHHSNPNYSHLTFLSPAKAVNSNAALKVVEYLIKASGNKGATRMLADVDENHPAFEMLRQASFAVYTRQRVWKVSKLYETSKNTKMWHPASMQNGNKIRALYHSLVPALVQQAEPFTFNNPQGLVFEQDGEIMAYVELKYGPKGIWAQPFIHPDTQDVSKHFIELIENIPYRRSRPIYICIKSYQFWLESFLEKIGAEPGPIQAIMVKHLAISQKATKVYEIPALERGTPEVTASIRRLEGKS